MTEQYKFKDTNEAFSILLVESDRDVIYDLSKQADFNPDELTVELKVNGKEIRIQKFNEIMEDWANRIESKIKTELAFNESMQAVQEKAEQLIRDKLGKAQDVLDEIENSLYKLEC